MTFRPYATPRSATMDSSVNVAESLQGGRSFRSFAEHLLSQQIWCWGQDIMRPDGNWLLEQGFQRERPPVDRKKCSSVYTLRLSEDRCVILRGFGVFWGDKRFGGVFLRRFEFQPLYSAASSLECPPWSEEDMPEFSASANLSDLAGQTLLLDLIDWIRSYEEQAIEQLGIEYRQAVLNKWDNGRRPIVPAADVIAAWEHVSDSLSSEFAKSKSAASA